MSDLVYECDAVYSALSMTLHYRLGVAHQVLGTVIYQADSLSII